MKKEFTKLKLMNMRYEYNGSSSTEMSHLGLFLVDDVGCFWPGFKEWALDPKQDLSTSNYASLEKEGNYILIGCEFLEEPDGGPYLKVLIEEFVKIIDQWEEFCKTKPKEILITKDGEKITIEGKW